MQALLRIILPLGYEFRPDLLLVRQSWPDLKRRHRRVAPFLAHHLATLAPLAWLIEKGEEDDDEKGASFF